MNRAWPKPEWFNLEPLLKECEDFSDKVIIGGFWSALFSDCFRMYGFQNFLMDLLMRPEFIKTLVNSATDFYLEMNERMFSVLKGKMDIFFLGSDFGSQQGLMFRQDIWLDIYYENYNKITELACSYGLTVMFHSCGSIAPLIPYFIELGVEIRATLYFDNGATCYVIGNWTSGRRIFRVNIHAPGICAEVETEKEAFLYAEGNYEGERFDTGEIARSNELFIYGGFQKKSLEFINSILSGKEETSSPFSDTLKTMEICETILALAMIKGI